MKLRPLQDWAVIRPSEAEQKTAGGLFIPDSAKDKPNEGVVEAIGPGALEEEKYGKKKIDKKDRKFIPTTVKPGDRVLYTAYAGQTYTIDDEERTLVRERDILGILSGDKAPGVTHTKPEEKSSKPAAMPEKKAPAKKAAAKKPGAKKK